MKRIELYITLRSGLEFHPEFDEESGQTTAREIHQLYCENSEDIVTYEEEGYPGGKVSIRLKDVSRMSIYEYE